ncbi:MAG: NAD(P)-dependent oxidoreductase [Bdellovibrionota bacterium]
MAKVAVTGVSSFTGSSIARALREAGHDVVGVCTKAHFTAYAGTLAGRRLARAVKAGVVLEYGITAEDDRLANWIESQKFDVYVHHHHYMTDFRSPDYDLTRALAVGLAPLPRLARALEKSVSRGIIYSTTYFESLGKDVSPYGYSKGEVGRLLAELSRSAKLPFSKIVIGNPIGPLENEDRLIPGLIRSCVAGKPYDLRSPSAITYPVPISVLTKTYVKAVEDLLRGAAPDVASPSLGPFENLSFAKTVLKDLIEARLKLVPATLALPDKETTSTPRPFVPANVDCDWAAFWDFYAKEFESEFQPRRSPTT